MVDVKALMIIILIMVDVEALMAGETKVTTSRLIEAAQ